MTAFVADESETSFALGLFEYHNVCMGLLPKPVKVSLDGIPSCHLEHIRRQYSKQSVTQGLSVISCTPSSLHTFQNHKCLFSNRVMLASYGHFMM